jgi:hypothetical protein
LGDFNFVTDFSDRQCTHTGALCGHPCGVAKFFANKFVEFAELFQPDFTRVPFGFANGTPKTAARLDRIYANFLPGDGDFFTFLREL